MPNPMTLLRLLGVGLVLGGVVVRAESYVIERRALPIGALSYHGPCATQVARITPNGTITCRYDDEALCFRKIMRLAWYVAANRPARQRPCPFNIIFSAGAGGSSE